MAPDDLSAQTGLAALLMRKGQPPDLEAAEKILADVLELAPDSGPAQRAMAAILAKQGGEDKKMAACPRRLLAHSEADPEQSSIDAQSAGPPCSVERVGLRTTARQSVCLRRFWPLPALHRQRGWLLLAGLYEIKGQPR